ncbi:hypothetical protein [Bradyrhizobium sp. NAS80.1]|uniref:hypothetical protein n=1 Tax=Bradyrhizobium sp. NAS80.1 TaxID=1680159 RepID=UPI001160F1C0|nr:hypothetical protein [Bradyrhizobium sp. NAS80.1]
MTVTPTLHNLTTATMSLPRRQAIAEICRRAGAWIIEDGVYAAAASLLPPLATLTLERSLHVNGLSKSVGLGLCVGVLALPPGMTEATEANLARNASDAVAPVLCGSRGMAGPVTSLHRSSGT